MNAVDVLALIVQASMQINTLATIIKTAREEGREELTPEEIAQVRAATIASEDRLQVATQA